MIELNHIQVDHLKYLTAFVQAQVKEVKKKTQETLFILNIIF